ncbi:voltage-gated potassium channel [Alteribacillus persepolensis]|uniref:Voltage-gated potassium channel n=1 Tax=Alteribacillus persepolensis TaxID=568899 RepID=A0A1G8C3M2_9BACI|nr:hypothetical protein [Alteribacillus persepolensis]SDH39974.1 voltage-gated potassium channel [Alteribacillus persepolensis]
MWMTHARIKGENKRKVVDLMFSAEESRSKIDFTYETTMVLLAAASIGTLWYDTGADNYIIWGTWSVFFADFLFRLVTSRSKWAFIKANPFIVIAVIPLDAVFQAARLARILHLVRLKTITKYYTMPFIRFLKQQNVAVVLSLSFVLLFLFIIPLHYKEPAIESFLEAFWSGLLSFLFFGRSNFEPVTLVGHILLVVLSIFGVIVYGLVLSIVADNIYHSKYVQKYLQIWKKHSKRK